MVTAWQHQADVLPHLLQKNFLLIWDPGVGKTLPLLECAKQRGGRCLYLGPPAIRTQVFKEAQEYGCFSAKEIFVVETGKDKIPPQAKLVICSYDHAIMQAVWKQLFKLDWATLALDEGHYLKNSAAKRTRAIYGATRKSPGALYKRAGRVLVATGTPIINDPSDYYTHVSRLLPDVLQEADIANKAAWLDRFCHVKQTPYGPKVVGAKNLDDLRTLLGPYTSRVKLEQVHDIPPLRMTQMWVPPTDIDFDGIPEDALSALEDLLRKGNVDRLEQLQTPLAMLRRRIGLAKAAHVADIVAEELIGGTGKVILFYHHKDVGATLMECLTSRKSVGQVAHYYGGMLQAKRDAVVKQFTGGDSRVLIAQMQAAGTGLNLQVADRVVIVEPAWTPALNQQAIARAYRAGQKKRVWASYVCLTGSVDEKITAALLRKQKIIEGAIG